MRFNLSVITLKKTVRQLNHAIPEHELNLVTNDIKMKDVVTGETVNLVVSMLH
jgi:hypothetical protein